MKLKMRQIKGLKYSIDSKNYFSGVPFFRTLKNVKFLIENKKIAEFIIDKNSYLINFSDNDQMKIICNNQIGTEFHLTETINNQTWLFSQSNKKFSFFQKKPLYLIKCNKIEVKINIHNNSLLYSIDDQLIGRVENKNILFLSESKTIDVLNEEYLKFLVGANCIELIREHIFKIYESF